MIEFGKIFCDLHPNQLITNYCSRDQCNMGLCATCICSHTESHIQRGTAPEYDNIRNTYSKMQESVRNRISALEHQKSRINVLVENIRNKRKNISDVISQARHETLDFVNRFFDMREKEILRKIEADEKKLGLHNENRMDSLLNIISRDVNSLFSAAQDLNSQDFLQSFHRIRTQVLANTTQTQREISEELDKNENFDVSISINPIYINEVKAGLEKSLTMIWDERKFNMKASEIREAKQNTNRNSRIVIVSPPAHQGHLENSNMVANQKRMSQSLPKPNISSQTTPSRVGASNFQQQPPSYLHKQASLMQFQPQSPTFRYQQQEPHISNNSVPVHLLQRPPNANSRVEIRVNSSERNIKENDRNPLTQSYMDCNFNQNSQLNQSTQLQGGRKIRRSGLTILRQVDNEK